jgi:hypothetical protein
MSLSGDEFIGDAEAGSPRSGDTHALAAELRSMRASVEDLTLRFHSAIEAIQGAQRAQQHAMEGLAAGQAMQQDAMKGLAAVLEAALRGVIRDLQQKDILDRASFPQPQQEAVEVVPPDLVDHAEYATMLYNRKVLKALEWCAQERLAMLDDAAVLEIARAASDWSCTNHPGVFASRSLESALRDLGRRQLRHEPPWRHRGSRRRVLHVLTVAHPIGGHTRLAERWMRFDSASEHSVMLTDQGEHAVPPSLLTAVDGRVDRLTSPTPLGRVGELGRLLPAHDVVVLHIHPYDVVAVAACADAERRPPTLFVDHGDHIFWIGVGAADVVVSARPSGAALALARRGIKPDQSFTIPLPLDGAVVSRDTVTAKARLGFPTDACVMLTMASAHKYGQVGDRSFTFLVDRVLSAVPDAYLLAVGPSESEAAWAALIERFGERVRVIGPTAETSLLLDATDLYLDSFPFGSPTSLFEAALHEIMPFSLREPDSGVLTVEDADVELPGATDAEAWVNEVVQLLRNDEGRITAGRRLAREIAEAHGPARLAPLLQEAYGRARHQADLPSTGLAPRLTSFDVALLEYQRSSGLGHSLEHLLESCGLLSGPNDLLLPS